MALRNFCQQSRAASASEARRALSTTARLRAYKDDQDKGGLNRTSHEYSLTGSDEATAENTETSFGNKHNDPEDALINSEGESKRIGQTMSPLNVSPANVEVSRAATHRPEHESIEKGTLRDASKSGKYDKAGRMRKYAKEGELSNADTGPSSAQTGR